MSTTNKPFNQVKAWGILLSAVGLLLLVSILGLAVGWYAFSLSELETIWNRDPETTHHEIIVKIRLPLLLTTLVGGMGLAAASVILQRVMRHRLADTGIMGLTEGGAFAACLVVLYKPDAAYPWYIAAIGLGTIVLGAFNIIFARKVRGGSLAVRSMLVGAIMIMVLLGCARLIVLFTDDLLNNVIQVYLGSSGAVYENWLLPCFALGLLGAIAVIAFKPSTDRARKGVLLASAVVVIVLSMGAAAAFGAIAFVGMLVSLLARRLVGGSEGWVLAVSTVLGAIVMVTLSIINRTLAAPYELPLYVLISMFGAPISLYLFYRSLMNPHKPTDGEH
ncbi:iron chelate uptake ABC transporter family permease subunit [Cohnella faecalis]|uniref:iron chelate uptake ABC transporter family permease subunit n=1 Tax=Cohnella faecalis TaxID=2315694 RepID=UPI001F3FAEE5|nr:iron chelate uptake ABC transporter family permease subunit [Cohnella faecalis]